MKNIKNNKRRGFTLIELLVVISIISLLSSIVLSSVQDARNKAKYSLYIQNAIQIKNALELYRSNSNTYPGEGGQLQKIGTGAKTYLEQALVNNNYISKIPDIASKDSDGNAVYVYYTGTYTGDDDGDFGDGQAFDGGLFITCGGKIPESYILAFYIEKPDLNFSKLGWLEGGLLTEYPMESTNIWYNEPFETLEGWYCVSQ